MKPLRDVRVIPVVVVAIAGLAVLKVAGLVLDGGYVFDYGSHATKKSWAQDNLNFPGGPREDDITGSVHGAPKEEKATEYARGLEEIIQRHNRATDGTIDAAYEYVNVIAIKRA